MRGLRWLFLTARRLRSRPKAPAGRREALAVIPIVEACDTELQQTKDLLQSTIEEMTTSQEELKSANEEGPDDE